MAPTITLYILAGCVGVAVVLFVVLLVLMLRKPDELPHVTPFRLATPLPMPLDHALSALHRETYRQTEKVPVLPAVEERSSSRTLVWEPRPLARAARHVEPDLDHRQLQLPAPPTVRLPIAPRRPRRVLRFALGTLAVLVIAAAVPIARPSVLDPLCDDYAWFGDDAVRVLRDGARVAHDAIYDLVHS
jgi:hypothetical protein